MTASKPSSLLQGLWLLLDLELDLQLVLSLDLELVLELDLALALDLVLHIMKCFTGLH